MDLRHIIFYQLMQSGFIDEYKKMNMIGRIGKEYDIENLENNKMTRLRPEPQTNTQNLYNQYNQPINQVMQMDGSVLQKFQTQRDLFRSEFQQMESIYNGIREAISDDKEFCFGQHKYTAPKGSNVRTGEDKNAISSHVGIRNQIKLKQTLYFDFQQIQNMVYDQDTEQGRVQNSIEDEIPFILNLREINMMDEIGEIEKTFSYQFRNNTFQSILKNKGVYQMDLVSESVEQSQDSLVELQYARDIGVKGRHPDLTNILLVNQQRQVNPQEIRFCDILNIASGRLVQQNIDSCLKSSASIKRQLESLRAVLFKINARSKQASDFQQQFGQNQLGKQVVVETSVQNSKTQRIVNQLTEMRHRASKLGSFKDDRLQRHFVDLLTQLLAKVVENTQIPNLEALKLDLQNYIDLVEGRTFSGFDKKKLLWFYADCTRYLKVVGKEEDICYLIQKSSKQNGTKTTVIQENPENYRRPYVQLHKCRVPGVVKSSSIAVKATKAPKHPASFLRPTRH